MQDSSCPHSQVSSHSHSQDSSHPHPQDSSCPSSQASNHSHIRSQLPSPVSSHSPPPSLSHIPHPDTSPLLHPVSDLTLHKTQGASGTFAAPGTNGSSDSNNSLEDLLPLTVKAHVPPQDSMESTTKRPSHSPTTSVDYTDFSDTRSFVTAPYPESQISEALIDHLEPHKSPKITNNNTFFNNNSFNSLNKSCKYYVKVKDDKRKPYHKKIKITQSYTDHFLIKVTLFFSDTSIQTLAMIDSGATGSFID